MKSFTTVDGQEFLLEDELILGFCESDIDGFSVAVLDPFWGDFNLVPITKESFDREGKTEGFFLVNQADGEEYKINIYLIKGTFFDGKRYFFELENFSTLQDENRIEVTRDTYTRYMEYFYERYTEFFDGK